MSANVYHLIHVVGVILLAGFTFQAFAAPKPESKGRTMMLTGILSVLVLVGGFGLLAKLGLDFSGWIIVKLVCWLGLSGMAGMAYRKPESAGTLIGVTALLITLAVYMVYFRPF